MGWHTCGVFGPSTDEQAGLHSVGVVGWGTCGLDSQFPFYDPEVAEEVVA